MNLLVYGAGVTGSLLAAKLSESGHNVFVCDRDNRLAILDRYGLIYKSDGEIRQADVVILDALEPDATYDYVFVCVDEAHLGEALDELKDAVFPNVVLMTITPDNYADLDQALGAGRLIPCLCQLGGHLDDCIVYETENTMMALNIIGEVSGDCTDRLVALCDVLNGCGLKTEMTGTIGDAQLCYLATVLPLMQAYHEADDPLRAADDQKGMLRCALRLRRNLRILRKAGYDLKPSVLTHFENMPLAMAVQTVRWMVRTEKVSPYLYEWTMASCDQYDELVSHVNTQLALLKKVYEPKVN